MTDNNAINYGPLQALIGVWKGDKGMDIAPEPDGPDENPYYETISFTPVEDEIENAETQELVAIHYRQIVTKKSDNTVFHDQTGYWMWDEKAGIIMQSLSIPRAVSLLAAGSFTGKKDAEGNYHLDVAAKHDNEDWQIIQSPFMRDNARTMEFTHSIIVGDDKLSYTETTLVDIYGRLFEHTDENTLSRA